MIEREIVLDDSSNTVKRSPAESRLTAGYMRYVALMPTLLTCCMREGATLPVLFAAISTRFRHDRLTVSPGGMHDTASAVQSLPLSQTALMKRPSSVTN